MKRGRSMVPWVAAAVVFAIAVTAGNWQLRRADEKRALQQQYDDALSAAPAPVATAVALAALGSQLPSRIRLTGEFVEPATVYIDNRIIDGVAGFHVVTALRIAADAPLVLIDRGWAARDMADRTRVPALPAAGGQVTIEGLAVKQLPRVLELGSATDAALGIWQNIDYERFEKATGLAVARAIVQQSGGAPDGLRRDRPRLDAGIDRHRGYAVQWFALAGLVIVLAIVYGVRARRAA